MKKTTKSLRLYHLESCPFCLRVRYAARSLGVELELVDIRRTEEARSMLLARRGRTTVPVLGIPTDHGEVLLPESNDIITYLQNHAASTHAA